jgi:hydroxymethylglutaryl-CoA lyase
MKMDYPNKVTLIEVGPRDGFQFEARTLPTEIKLQIIEGLVHAGLKHIQVASFVNPARVPQMADAEELARGLPEADGVEYSGLVLNSRGVERAYHSGMKHVEISISASDTHSRKNTGMTLAQAQTRNDFSAGANSWHGYDPSGQTIQYDGSCRNPVHFRMCL